VPTRTRRDSNRVNHMPGQELSSQNVLAAKQNSRNLTDKDDRLEGGNIVLRAWTLLVDGSPYATSVGAGGAKYVPIHSGAGTEATKIIEIAFKPNSPKVLLRASVVAMLDDDTGNAGTHGSFGAFFVINNEMVTDLQMRHSYEVREVDTYHPMAGTLLRDGVATDTVQKFYLTVTKYETDAATAVSGVFVNHAEFSVSEVFD